MTLTSVSKIIEAFGGRQKFARLMQTSPQAVDNWRRAKVFPANTYTVLRDILSAAGDTAPDRLWAMRKRKRN